MSVSERMVLFTTKQYIDNAIANGLIVSVERIDEFKAGNMRGFEAIKAIYDVKALVPLRAMQTIKHLSLKTIIDRLRNREYDGKSLNDILVSETEILGERITLYNDILNKSEVLLSEDKLYSLPLYQPSTSVMDRSDLVPLLDKFMIFKGKTAIVRPRTRKEIADFCGISLTQKYSIDVIIQSLVQYNAI